jgi:hypothetical protein
MTLFEKEEIFHQKGHFSFILLHKNKLAGKMADIFRKCLFHKCGLSTLKCSETNAVKRSLGLIGAYCRGGI